MLIRIRPWARRLCLSEWDLVPRESSQLAHALAVLIQGQVEAFRRDSSSNVRTPATKDSPLSPNKIAERLIISRASVTGLLDSLERRGYVQRTPHGSDRRMLLIELTDAGRKAARDFRPIVHRHEKGWLGALSEKEQRQLIDLLHRIQATLAASEESA